MLGLPPARRRQPSRGRRRARRRSPNHAPRARRGTGGVPSLATRYARDTPLRRRPEPGQRFQRYGLPISCQCRILNISSCSIRNGAVRGRGCSESPRGAHRGLVRTSHGRADYRLQMTNQGRPGHDLVTFDTAGRLRRAPVAPLPPHSSVGPGGSRWRAAAMGSRTEGPTPPGPPPRGKEAENRGRGPPLRRTAPPAAASAPAAAGGRGRGAARPPWRSSRGPR